MENGKLKASIIIPHYNQKDCLPGLFLSLVDQTCDDFEVIVIDDCTPDQEAVAYIREFFKNRPNMHLVQNEVNLRFVRTCNKGIKLAKGEYICLLNSDTVLENNFVQRNVEILDSDTSIGGITCSIVDQFGKNWFTGGRYNKGVPVNLKDDFDGVRPVDFIAGTAAFYRKDVFDKIGLFDENFIMYHEDVEFGLRVRNKTGYRLCTFSDKLVTHLIMASIPREGVWYYSSRNLLMLSKRYSPKYLPQSLAHVLVHYIVIHLVRAIRYAIAGIRGTIDGIMGTTSKSYQ